MNGIDRALRAFTAAVSKDRVRTEPTLLQFLLTFDIYGNVEPITIEQILDKDVLELYSRDLSPDKGKYKKVKESNLI